MNNVVLVLSELDFTQKRQVLIDLKSGSKLFYLDNIALDDELRERGESVSSMGNDVSDDLLHFFKQVKDNSHLEGVKKNIPFLDGLVGSMLEPLFACLRLVTTVIKLGGSIYVYCAKYTSKKIPLVGYKTIESPFGSSLLLGAYIGNVIKGLDFESSKVSFRYRRRDILCYGLLRLSIIKIIEVTFYFNFIVKLLRLRLRLKNINIIHKKETFKGYVFIARTHLQIQYASDLAGCSPDVGVDLVLIPQGRLGRLDQLIDVISIMPNNIRLHLPSVRHTLVNVFKFLVFNDKGFSEDCVYTFPYFNYSFSSRSINEESRWFLYEGTYSSNLRKTLPQNCKKILNFSLKGRYAIFEKNMADALGIPISTIQTANLDANKSYVFPVSDFYCDSKISYNLDARGFNNTGKLFYEGCPFKLKGLVRIKKTKKITFFTQPYEFEINLVIIRFLLNWCKINGSSFVVKLHPRDDESNYLCLGEEALGLFTFLKNGPVRRAIEMSDICITRTSAIGVEALALGVPSLYCVFSDFDHSVKYGYINLIKSERAFAENVSELKTFLDNTELLNELCERMQDTVFGGKDILNLSHSLFVESKAL